MGNFKTSKDKMIAGMVLLCVFFAPAVLTLRAEGEKKTPETAAPADPNAPQKNPDAAAAPAETEDKEEPESTDPNAIEAISDDDDVFMPKISTLVMINEAYGQIFTPELVSDEGRIDYGTLKRKRVDMITAERNLKKLNPAVLMSLSDDEREAFWINTYNYCTISVILRNYPIQPKWFMILYPDNSIMQITAPWTKEYFEIQQFEYNLDEIEQEFLLQRYKDPRICFALSNASMGGAILRNEPYTAERLDAQLDDQVRQYLAVPDRGMRIDKTQNVLFLSNLFRTYKDVFLTSKYAEIRKFRDRKDEERAWLNFILPYLSPEEVSFLETTAFQIRFIDYDWHLNDTH